jgi:hypothetical protein
LALGGVVTGAIGLAALGVGIGFSVATRSAVSAALHPPDGVFQPAAESRALTDQGVEIAGLVVGVAALAVGAALIAVSVHRHRASPALRRGTERAERGASGLAVRY